MADKKCCLRKYVLAAAGILGTGMIIYGGLAMKNNRITYPRTEEVFYNPGMGFAPNADYMDAVGENTLVYVDVTWRELEPEEGVYDFAGIAEENYLDRWRSDGKNVVFRFVCDNPSGEEHMDIPDWLYEKTGDGVFYDTEYGKGYSPDYRNETFIEYHRKAIEALGKEYGRDDFFCYIELGSLGHWGEWHVKYDAGIPKIPSEEVCMKYVKPYLTAFPDAKLLMRRPFSAVSEYGLGIYNDMTGEPESTGEWLSWIENGSVYAETEKPMTLPACPKVWEQAPVGGELTSSLSMEDMLIFEKKQTLSLLGESHMTFIGPKCPTACGEELEYPEETAALRNMLGYRYGVSEMKISRRPWKKSIKVWMTFCNYGVAPMYFDWPVCLYTLDHKGTVTGRYQTEVKLSELPQDSSMEIKAELPEGSVAVGIENPRTGEPEVYLDMETEQKDFRYLLWQKE